MESLGITTKQVATVKDCVDFCKAGRALGVSSNFSDKLADMSDAGNASNHERDFLRFARKSLGVDFQTYDVDCIVRKHGKGAVNMNVPILLPHEVCHWLWHFAPTGFRKLWFPERITQFWSKVIAADEEWFRRLPLRVEIINAADRTKYLPIKIFGDDGCLRKSRVMKTITWYPATHSEHSALHSRIPVYVIPQHLTIPDVTETSLQTVLVWSFEIWLTGRMPKVGHAGAEFASGTFRHMLAQADHPIAGGHVGVYVDTIADALWMSQHYRFASNYIAKDICHRCYARNDASVLNFCSGGTSPQRAHDDFMASDGAKASPLTRLPGYHFSMNRGEAMHAGPLGAMQDAVGSTVI